MICQTSSAYAQTQPDAPKVSYTQQIQPIFAKHCFACHGPGDAESGLALNQRETALSEADSGETPIVPGNALASHLIARITSREAYEQMPPEGDRLSRRQVDLIKQWINEGAEYDQHWAFQPVADVEVPSNVRGLSSSNPIDAFIQRQLNEKGLTAAPPADRKALLRRLYYDLTGLPPTQQEIHAFESDQSDEAYEKVVDRLLDSPHYGEKWARHWLDVVRYAETNSFERDGTKPNAWKYRDYVIESFNEDKPYDQFIIEQLAGDELDDETRETITATGFYRLGIWDDEPADPLLARYDELDNIITTVSQGFLGLTVNCGRCHDHKIDPIPQADYYSMLAFFEGLTPYGRRGDERTFSQTDVSSPELREQYEELQSRQDQLKRQTHAIEQEGIRKMDAPDQRATEGRRREKVLKEKLQDHLEESQWIVYRGLKDQLDDIEDRIGNLPPRETVLSVAKANPRPKATTIMMRGNPHVPGDVVRPAFLSLFEDEPPQIEYAEQDAHSSGRRLVLAKWIASPDNRLTARVMVNRIWQHHFGRGIVRSANNFGQLGTPPTHPELLDWLANQFVNNGWSIKAMHKLIVTSAAYKRSSTAVPESLAKDPGNESFWRFEMRRLTAEEIRDSMLAVAGSLNLKLYGPSIYPRLSREVLRTQSKPGAGWGKSSQEQENRRSIYIFVKRSLVPPELTNFDFPDTDNSCEARFVTTQPAQALGMVNGDFSNRIAATFAARLREEHPDNAKQQVRRGLELVLNRQPSSEDIADANKLIEALKTEHDLTDDEALYFFCLYAINLNEFVYLD